MLVKWGNVLILVYFIRWRYFFVWFFIIKIGVNYEKKSLIFSLIMILGDGFFNVGMEF